MIKGAKGTLDFLEHSKSELGSNKGASYQKELFKEVHFILKKSKMNKKVWAL